MDFSMEISDTGGWILKGTTELSRKDFDLKFGGMDELVADKIKVRASVYARPVQN